MFACKAAGIVMLLACVHCLRMLDVDFSWAGMWSMAAIACGLLAGAMLLS